MIAFVARVLQERPRAEGDAQRLWYWMEDHGELVLPVFAVAVVALVAVLVRRSGLLRADELRAREQRKDETVRLMRSRLFVTADELAQRLGLDRLEAAALLAELTREGKLIEQRGEGGVAGYRLRGL